MFNKEIIEQIINYEKKFNQLSEDLKNNVYFVIELIDKGRLVS